MTAKSAVIYSAFTRTTVTVLVKSPIALTLSEQFNHSGGRVVSAVIKLKVYSTQNWAGGPLCWWYVYSIAAVLE